MKKDVIHTYAAYNKNEKIRINSSSGGVFTLLAEFVLNDGGIVYGVAMSNDCYSNNFERVCNTEDLKKLRGSKYIQAKMGSVYNDVSKDLKKGIKVLFSGTGCQINGLKCFLQKDYDNLFCVDIVCHGVPSQKVWKKYVESIETERGKLESINFRSKELGWIDFGLKENELFVPKDSNSFFQFFNRCYCLRPSCYCCTAKDDKRSDITIADFWGIENILPELSDDKGVSLVLIRTNKGDTVFQSVKDKMYFKEVSYEEGIRENSSEYISHDRPCERDIFFSDLERMSIKQLENKYIKVPMWKRVGRKVKRTIKKILGGVPQIKQRTNADYGMLLTFKKR